MGKTPATLTRSWRAFREAPDEQARMGQIAGLLWMAAAAVTLIGAFLPGADHEPIGWLLVVVAGVFLYGLASATRLIHWDRASIRIHAIGTAATLPVVGLSLYLTGNANSYVEPLLVIPLFYSAFFFPRRIAWLLTLSLLIVAGVPLLTDPDVVEQSFLPRYLAIWVAFVTATWMIVGLRERLDATEQRQREIAGTDPLTGIGNRRTFDRILNEEMTGPTTPGRDRHESDHSPFALILFDLDGFKSVNDRFGHLVGDQILCDFTECVAGLLREGDTLVRIGGDEFAVIVPGAESEQAARIAASIESSTAEYDGEHPLPTASIGWAIFPREGQDYESLMRLADERMLEIKAGRRSGRRTGKRSVIPGRRSDG